MRTFELPYLRTLLVGFALCWAAAALAIPPPDLSAELSAQGRYFPSQPLFDSQNHLEISGALRPKASWQWDNRRQTFEIQPFLRVDSADSKRTHFDITTLSYVKAWDKVELRLGVRKVYWGVAESQHLVDIINQTDLVEDFRGYTKLGQPMINPALISDLGTFELFILPYFRERTFPGENGHFRTPFPVDAEGTQYQAGAKRFHPDLAARWSNRMGMFDVGLSHFVGTSRQPTLRATTTGSGSSVLVPYYPLIQQSGADIQMTAGPVLGKLDAIVQGGELYEHPYFASTAGIEYTISQCVGPEIDLGILVEYLYDSRGKAGGGFENDLFAGLRLTASNSSGLTLLGGGIIDLTSNNQVFVLEVSRRLGSTFRLTLKGGVFNVTSSSDPLYAFRQESYAQLDLAAFL